MPVEREILKYRKYSRPFSPIRFLNLLPLSHMFGQSMATFVPPMLGKALGGGVLPIAACIARADLDVAGAYALGHYTHEKNPVTTRAALTTIQIIEEEDLVENAAKVGAAALARLHEMKMKYPMIGDGDLKVAKLYDMLPAETAGTSQGRTAATDRAATSP